MNRNLSATILIILAVGLYFTVTKGVLTEASVIRSSNDEYVKAIENAKNLISVRDRVLADFNNLSAEDRARLDKMVPQSVDNIRLIIDLNNIALRYGFSLKGIQATASSDATNNANNQVSSIDSFNSTISNPVLNTVTVTFSVSAPYQQFITFLQDLESSLRILDITNLSLTSTDSGIYDWKVELKTYWLRN